jgi:hypothetical protein
VLVGLELRLSILVKKGVEKLFICLDDNEDFDL